MRACLFTLLFSSICLPVYAQPNAGVIMPKGQRPYYEMGEDKVYGKITVPEDSSKTIEKKNEYIRNQFRREILAAHKFIDAPEHKALSKLLFGEANQIEDALYSNPKIDVVALHKRSKVILDSLDVIPHRYFTHKTYDLSLAVAHRLGRTKLGKQVPEILAFYTQLLIDKESPNPGLLYACLKQLQAAGYWNADKLAVNAKKVAASCEAYYAERAKFLLPDDAQSNSAYSRFMAVKKQQVTQLRQLAAK